MAPRGDGLHYTTEGSLWVARWLMPQLGIAALDKPDNTLPVMKMVVSGRRKGPQGNAATRHRRILQGRSDQGRVPSHWQCAAQRGHRNRNRHTWLRALRWDTTGVPNGTYTVRSVAYNAAGDATREQRHHRSRQELTGAVTQICWRALATSLGFVSTSSQPSPVRRRLSRLRAHCNQCHKESGQEAKAYPGSGP